MSIYAFYLSWKLRLTISNFPTQEYDKAHVLRMQDDQRNEKNKIW